MAAMKQCPQCGKYVPADRTYCMSCGVTLGVRCPGCRAVLPVGTKVCTECGHSFVKKKKAFDLPLWRSIRKHAPRYLMGSVILLLLLSLVASAFPAILVRTVVEEHLVTAYAVSGLEMMLYFFGMRSEGIELLLTAPPNELTAGTQAILYGGAAAWFLLLISAGLAVTLLACNLRRMGRKTAGRLLLPSGLSLGGAALQYGLSLLEGLRLRETLPADTALPEILAPWSLVALIAAGVIFLFHLFLYAAVLRRWEGSEEELSLSQILSVPIGLIERVRRAVWRRIRKKSRRGKKLADRDEPAFTVTPRFTTYLVLLGVALVFTQALLNKISNIFFWFVLILPFVMLVYVLLARLSLAVSMHSDSVTLEKNQPHTYEFHIDNHSILALPFIEALVSIPQSNSVRCTERIVRMSLAPLSGYCMKNTVCFRFRGTYDIGVRCFYIYDFFRLFRLRVDVENLTTVYVLPRRLNHDDTLAQAISDSTARTVRSPLVVDKLEVNDIRDYQSGDPLKNIHWKLSSKSEEFIVKDYNTGTANQTVVFCDLGAHFPDESPEAAAAREAARPLSRREKRAARKAARAAKKKEAAELRRAKGKRIRETADTHAISDEELAARLSSRAAVADILDGQRTPADTSGKVVITEVEEAVDVHALAAPAHYDDMNEYLADGVVEITVAMVLSELRQGHEVLLLWFDRRADSGVYGYTLRGVEEFENIYHLFATAPLCGDKDVTSLVAMADHIQSAKQLFVVSTLDNDMFSRLTALPGVSDAGNFGSVEVVLYSPEERFKYPEQRSSYLEGCREQLAMSGLSLTAGSFGIQADERTTPNPEGGKPHEA